MLIENLHLVDEDSYLIRAAMLAFYHDPERWVTGAYIKIGFFGNSDSDLQYQDEIHGPLIEQIDRTIDLVYTKYMKARITYDSIQRVEVFMFPREAFREILLNAVVHKDYSSCNPIQISVYEDHMYIWNDGQMPENLRTTESLFAKHSSKPYNPKLAYVFFVSGMIEAWGRGFDKIKTACEALYDTPVPEYNITDDGIMVHCKANQRYLQLSGQEWVINDDPIMSIFREDELPFIDAILKLIDQQGCVKNADVKAIMGKSPATAKRLLSKMVSAHLIVLEGVGRGQKYVKCVR